MKKALLIGCGGKRGEDLIKGCQQANFDVINIGSSESKLKNVENIKIEWKTFDIIQMHKICKQLSYNFDFIFFNQNSSALAKENFINTIKTVDLWSLTKNWSKSYWLSCQFPFALIKTLEDKINKDAIIGWMLSSYIDKNVKGVDDHADYSGYKFTNYLVMKNFAKTKKYQCFGINPEFGSSNYTDLIYKICSNQIECDGQIIE